MPIWGRCVLLQRSRSISPPSRTCMTSRQDAVPLALLRGPAILTIRELVLLKAGCKPGTGLTSYLPKRKGSATSYPGRTGERSLTAFSPLLAPESVLVSFTCSPELTRSERGAPHRAWQTWLLPGLHQSSSWGAQTSARHRSA